MELDPLYILKKYWGYDQFRSIQKEIIDHVLDGRDTIALLPTGGGKSICFQIPALVNEGICLVISPLIALMKDQVQNLNQRGINAVAIYSGMSYKEIDRTFDNCLYGNVKLLYLSPERIQTDMALARIERMKVNLIAVDEAHCISQWGYDFRPSYLKIAELRNILPDVPMIALTATATPDVVKDIRSKLKLNTGQLHQISFTRSNLAYMVLKESDKRNRLISILQKINGTSIVYVSSRRMCKEVALFLQSKKINADFYHAGLEKTERSDKQDAWLKGSSRVMVATNAFGMGIDHPRVRSVIHLTPPPSLEAYFQEAGRGGRDGKKSFAILMYDDKDIDFLEEQFEQSFPPLKEIKQVYQALGSFYSVAVGVQAADTFDFDLSLFCTRYGFGPMKVLAAIRVMEENGYIFATEAVFVPSKLSIIVEKTVLYDFLLKHAELGDVLRALMRLYQGISEMEVNIDEFKLARFVGKSKQELMQNLHFLHKSGLIQFTASKESPQLGYLKPRVSVENFTIDHSTYNFLKERRRFMLDSVKYYIFTNECRSQLLVEYFGEKLNQDCGICDVCISRKKQSQRNVREQEVRSKLMENFESKSQWVLLDLLSTFSYTDRKLATEILQQWSEEELIHKTDQWVRLLARTD
ncbi:MAG: RecQ family ATP-dependent DNA helicase [Saprospiraceae bacterium]|nr:RecQ family ATP-dependent DNA helicase [Saprospiraceae bacterium]